MSQIAMVALLTGLFGAGGALAAPNDLVVTLYADRAAPYLDPATGAAYPFMCLAPVNAPKSKPACFGFYPRGETITSIQLSDGATLVRGASGWTETPGGFRFTQLSGPADNVVLRDGSRNISWTLSIPRGGSLVASAGKTAPWRQVTSVTFEPAARGFIGSDWAGGDYQEPTKPWAAAGLKFSKVIDAQRRTDLLSIVDHWNAGASPVTRGNMVDLLDAVAATIGVRRPPRSGDEGPADYLGALIHANPAPSP
jgi:hypothetical protein